MNGPIAEQVRVLGGDFKFRRCVPELPVFGVELDAQNVDVLFVFVRFDDLVVH